MAKWLTQVEGIINIYESYDSKIFQGSQPIRVAIPMAIHMFKHSDFGFHKKLIEKIKEGKLNNELDIRLGTSPLHIGNGNFWTPRVSDANRKIQLHETFLSYLWCITYSNYVEYIETVDYPKLNKQLGEEKYPISQQNINGAKEVFAYGKSLIVDYTEWDKENLANPEIYMANSRDYIEQTNCFFTEAIKFILCHEFAHIVLHLDILDENTPDSHYQIYEEEADKYALDTISKMKNGVNRWAIEVGVVFAVLSMFYFKASTESKKHPNTEDRLTNILELQNLDDEHYAWGIACIGLKNWSEQFQLGLSISKDILTPKQLYYDLVSQIKNM